MKRGRIEVNGRPLEVVLRGNELVDGAGDRHAPDRARFLPPVTPGNFYAAGLNYRAHIEWANAHHGGNYKIPTQADIVVPADSPGPVEFEGELVAVIGSVTK